MSLHKQFAEDLALYALNALEGEERASLEKHLATCADCRLELEQLRGDGALLALSTVGAKPPARSRQRLLDAIAKESSSESRAKFAAETARPRRSWWGWLGWAATAAVIVFAASLWKDNSALRRELISWRSLASHQELELGRTRDVLATLTASEAMHVTLVAVKTPAQPQGKAFYMRNRGSLVFIANNMPALPAQKAYELWLIPAQGAPIPAGVFKPDAHGSATMVNPPLPPNMEAKAFAITVENESGATTPTMPIMMIGTGE
jgi:anti-sigma-K factor RskA